MTDLSGATIQVLTGDRRVLDRTGLPQDGDQWVALCDAHWREFRQLAGRETALDYRATRPLTTNGPCDVCLKEVLSATPEVPVEDVSPKKPAE